jgi:glycosyltransferase involved in cell wall biosynthesis
MQISIITVCFNAVDTINQTIQSIKEQDYPDMEYIVIDGASNDGTNDIITLQKEVVNQYISEKDHGLYDAMNKGIAKANGEIIGILNADDLYHDHKVISNIMKEFEADPLLDAVYGDLYYFKGNETDKPVRFWKSKDFYKGFFEDGYSIPHPTLFMRKSVYQKYGNYYPNFKISSDYEFCLRAFGDYKLKIKNLNSVIVKMRMGGESTSSFKNILLGNKEIITSWKMNNKTIPPFFFLKKIIFKLKQKL